LEPASQQHAQCRNRARGKGLRHHQWIATLRGGTALTRKSCQALMLMPALALIPLSCCTTQIKRRVRSAATGTGKGGGAKPLKIWRTTDHGLKRWQSCGILRTGTDALTNAMKPTPAMQLVRTLLLIGALSTAFESDARPPRQHSVVGVVESIDHVTQTLVLVKPVTKVSRSFVWTDKTRFRCDGERSRIDTLQPGILVKGSYQNSSGRSVLRVLRWSHSVPGKNKGCIRCNC